MRISAEKSIVLVIDIQERLLPAMAHKEDILKNSVTLLKGAAVHAVPVVATEQYPKGLGSTVPEVKEAAPDMAVFAKTQFSALEQPVLDKMYELKAQGRDTVIILGMEAHVCVLQTIRDLIEEGFTVVMAVDCMASRKDSDKEVALKRADDEGAVFATMESVLFEWTVGAKNEHFKEISALVK